MDFMKKNKSKIFFYNEIADLTNRIKKSNVIDNPFPHIIIEDGISNDITFDRLKLELVDPQFVQDTIGRTEYRPEISPDDDIYLNLEKTIINKFNLNPPVADVDNNLHIIKSTSFSLWEDTHELDIQEIHLDYLVRNPEGFTQIETNYENQTVFSIHIYLPDDDLHTHLGTSIYSVSSEFDNEDDKNNFYVKPDYPIISNTLITGNSYLVDKYCNTEFTIPFKKGIVYIHPTSPNSWHSAPKIPKGYTRKSLMFRVCWTYFTKDTNTIGK
tara:strand:- start:228 stop:1037 length:810 start_codon:yes stop_codon:yes gene_type:complete